MPVPEGKQEPVSTQIRGRQTRATAYARKNENSFRAVISPG